MKNFLLALSILTVSATTVFSQKTAASLARPTLTAKDSALCKAWKITSTEQFGVVSEPNEKQKNDGVTYMTDGTAFLMLDGIQKTGTWTADKAKTYVTIAVDGSTEKFRFKIMNLTKDQLLFEYQDPELIRIKYTCVPAKK